MKERLLDLLACPRDGSDLRLSNPSYQDEEVKEGTLTCEGGHRFPVSGYIPRFVPSDLYVRSFSKEWLIHRTTQYDDITGIGNSRQAFSLKTGFPDDGLRGRRVLEAGCGSGRFLAVGRSLGAEMVGLDLSRSVDAAMQMVGKDRYVHLVEGDILQPPFKKEVFDFVYSIGVLHHTKDARQGFLEISKVLKRGGEIAIWVYPDDGILVKAMNLMGGLYRRGARMMSLETLYYLCQRIETSAHIPRVLLDSGYFSPDDTFANRRFHPRQAFIFALPFFSLAPTLQWRILDTFDYLSPTYQTKHTWKEVAAWFGTAGMVDVRRLPIAVSYLGRKA